MKARVFVTLKAGILDPQGKAIEGALGALGIDGVTSVRQGKIFEVEVAAGSAGEARGTLARASEVLLANTVIENFAIEIDDAAAAADPTQAAAADAEMPVEGHP